LGLCRSSIYALCSSVQFDGRQFRQDVALISQPDSLQAEGAVGA
jgi:hypothetical protein